MNTEYSFSTVNNDGSPCPLIINVKAKSLEDAIIKAKESIKDTILEHSIMINDIERYE